MDILKRLSAGEREWAVQAVDLLKILVARDTTDYHEKNGQAVVVDYLEKLDCEISLIRPDPQKLAAKYKEFNGGHTYEDRDCVVAVFKGTGGGRSILLNSHMDTVFPAALERWLTDPFEPVEKDGSIFGLGACDTKGGMAAVLTALRLIQENDVRLKGDVIFESVVDEEAGGGNGTLACIDAGYKADAVLVTEPNMLEPASAHVGSYAAVITVYGKSAHGNLKWEGVSALEKALPLMNRLTELEKKWNQRKSDILPSPVLTILHIEAGDGSITLPDVCKMLVNFTYLPDGYDYEGEFMGTVRRCEAADSWFADHPVDVQLHHNVSPYYTSPDGVFPMLAAQCVSAVTGRETTPTGLPCGADARFFANLGGMDTIVMGPGSISDAHKPNEYVRVKDFIDAVKAYACLICEWCGVEQ